MSVDSVKGLLKWLCTEVIPNLLVEKQGAG